MRCRQNMDGREFQGGSEEVMKPWMPPQSSRKCLVLRYFLVSHYLSLLVGVCFAQYYLLKDSDAVCRCGGK